MRANWMLLFVTLAAVNGCMDQTTAPRDLTPPAAPRGFVSVTGDHTVYLSWYRNTEADVAGYRIYQGPCGALDCPYLPIATVPGAAITHFTLTGLANGVTTYFAVAAYDYAGNEGDLSYDTVFDTPRPEGFGARLLDYQTTPALSGWDFSAQAVRRWDDAQTDVFYGSNGAVIQMFTPDYQTDIQDAGFASTLDAVDFAPTGGWSPTGSVELIAGHCYVVWTRDNHYAKFRVTRFIVPSTGPPTVEFDWAYQVDTGNRELKARPAAQPNGAGRRPVAWIR